MAMMAMKVMMTTKQEEAIDHCVHAIQRTYTDETVLRMWYQVHCLLQKHYAASLRIIMHVYMPEILYTHHTPSLKQRVRQARDRTDLAVYSRYGDKLGMRFHDEDEALVWRVFREGKDAADAVFARMCALCEVVAPHVHALTGPAVCCALLAHAGTLRQLSILTSARIQVLGARKALGAHKDKGASSPKHGYLYTCVHNHAQPGRAARQLACKIAIAAKIDYARGAQ